jgi:hypothetical protein
MYTQDALHFWIAAAVFAAIALFGLYNFFYRLRRDRLVADTPLVRIRSAAQGYVKVAGRAAPAAPAPTAAPLSSRSCVWWSYEVAREERNSKGNVTWRTVDSATSVELFVLTDDDAQCLVGPVKAEITPTTHDIWYGTASRPLGPPPRSPPLMRAGAWRYTERLLSVGDRLSVMGELRSHSEVGNISSATAEKLRQWKQDQQTLLARFDADHDGRIDGAEWESARAAAASESQTQTLQSSISRISVISEPSGGEPFLIAPLSSDALEKREKRFAGFYFVMALIGVILCAWAVRHADALANPHQGPAPSSTAGNTNEP